MIIGEVRRYLRDNNSIRVSRSLRDIAYKALQAKEQLSSRLSREPSVVEIAREIGAEGIRLNSGARRTAAHAFYEAWGYTCRKEQRNYFKLLID